MPICCATITEPHTRLASFGLTLLPTCVSVAIAQPAPPILIGGFDAARGGRVSLSDGDMTQSVRDALRCAFPSAVIASFADLTSASVRDFDVLILSSLFDARTAITPLTTVEQDVLMNFVLAGGTLVLCVDNDAFAGHPASSIANNSLLAPFGVHVTGTVTQFPAPVTVSSPGTSSVTSGFFGTVSDFNMYLGGWFDSVAPHVDVLGMLDTAAQRGEPALVQIAPRVLSTGSGSVVMFADASILFNQFFSEEHRVLFSNAADLAPNVCYADCETTTGIGMLDICDFLCFQSAFVSGECYADCDRSTGAGTLDIFDFLCFQDAFVSSCP